MIVVEVWRISGGWYTGDGVDKSVTFNDPSQL